MSTYKKFVQMRSLIESLEPEAVQVEEKRNKAAGRRLRKGLQEVKKLAQNLRAQVMEDLA